MMDEKRLELLQRLEQLRSEVAELEEELGDTSDDVFRLVERSSPDLISILSAEGKILFASSASRPLIGIEPLAFLGTDVHDWIHPDDVHRVQDLQSLSGENDAPVEYRMRHANSGWVWVESRTAVLPEEEKVVCITRDISDRVAAEKQLNKSKVIRDAISLVAPVAIVALGADQKVLSCIGSLLGVDGPTAFEQIVKDVPAVDDGVRGALTGTDSNTEINWDGRRLDTRYVSLFGQMSGAICAIVLFLEPLTH